MTDSTQAVPADGASQPPRGEAAIELNNLVKRFGSFTALDNLTLAVERGEIFGLLGPNGSGKTTTINIISGLAQPTSGSAHVLGYDVTRNARAARMGLGVVPQETALYEELSAWRNMEFHAELYNVPRAQRDRRITDLLQLVQLYDRRDSRAGTFSGGMKRRLALARAMLHDPQLLYLDEPTLGVDVQSRRALWDYILDLKAQGKTLLITTNYLEEASVLCDRLAILDHGKLIALGAPDDLRRRFGDTVLEIGMDPAPSPALIEQLRALPGVAKLDQGDGLIKLTLSGERGVTGAAVNLVTAEGALTSVTQREPNLDEIFLSLTGSALRD
ncbi:MAG TPA: ATP-binding cassette domain-containing protein [Ktedonobacterales bacterium]